MSNISTDELTALAARALERAGASTSMALATAKALVAADAEGLGTHGVSRVALYAQHLRQGRVDGKARPRIVKRKRGVCLVDARNGLAYEACVMAGQQVVERAQRYGVAFCGVTNSHHFGAAGYHLAPIGAVGLAGLAFSNSPSAINPWGGKRALYGTNPVAAIFPRKDEPPVVVDLSLTEVVRGRIMLYAKEGKPIPAGWALDSEGRPTTDARAALTGSLAAIGGVKGTMLALIVEVLCCAVTGAAFSFENDSYFEPGGKPRIGHAMFAIDPEFAAGRDSYLARMEVLIQRMLSESGVRLPGVRRHAARAQASTAGIEIPPALLEELQRLAAA